MIDEQAVAACGAPEAATACLPGLPRSGLVNARRCRAHE